jgi:AAA domain/CHC2 zinc finger
VVFPDSFIEELRARVPVSEVVGRKVKLKRVGQEFVGLSPFQQENSPSFTVNDAKGFYHDFSSGKHGDHFDFIQETEGCDFPQAVKRVAEIGGIPLPPEAENRAATIRDGADERPEPPFEPDAGGARADGPGTHLTTPREITKTYDYTDAGGALVYQVCRSEWLEEGKRKKTFMQRRPAPGGGWIWGLSAGDFLKGRDGDWYQATDKRIEQWHGAERATFTDAAQHGLYRLVEFNELKSGDPVFILEGEKDVDTARAWELVATTNSGGARHWRADHAALFAGLDVVIPIDNDKAGRERGDIIARSLRKIARSVRVLDWATIWKEAPKGADLTDWKEQAGGTSAKLAAVVAQLPTWTPPPMASKFGLVMWGDHNAGEDEYDYLIEDLIPEREAVLIMGETQSGKSFFTMGMGHAGASGREFFGRRVLKPFGVVYCAYEAGKGFRRRMRAHDQYFGAPTGRLPFAVLTKPVDLWSADINADQLIEEIIAIAETQFGDVELGAVVIDTHNRATPGASEIDSQDVSKIIDRYSRIMEKTRAGIWIVGHTNAAGKHRGNQQLANNIETSLEISRKTEEVNKERMPIRDADQRDIRIARVLKQREGEDGGKFEFVLPKLKVGTNKYGLPKYSCVAVSPRFATNEDGEATSPTRVDSGLVLNAEQQTVLQALRNALNEHGEAAPTALRLPKSIRRVVKATIWKDEYLKIAPDAAEAKANTINARLKRASERLQTLRVIGRINPWVWTTGRAVRGVIEAASAYDSPAPSRGPEPPPPDDVPDLLK